MAGKKKVTKRKRVLIKRGAPLPGKPSFKFDSSHLTERSADDRLVELLDNPRVKDTHSITIPRQHAVYVKRGRITPKRPRIR